MENIVITENQNIRIHTYINNSEEESVAMYETAHIIETKNTLILVDALFFRPEARKLKAYIESLGKPLDRIIISHSHPDHWLGLEYFRDVPLYALPETSQEIDDFGERMIAIDQKFFGDLTSTEKVVPQHKIVEGETVIDGVRFEFEKLVDAEATVQLVVKLPDLKAIIVQDLVFENTHLFLGADRIDDWVEKLTYLKNQSAYDKVLTGHGEPQGTDCYDRNIKYLKTAKELIKIAVDGKDLKRKLIDAYPDYKGAIGIDIANEILFDQSEIVKDIWKKKGPEVEKAITAKEETPLDQTLSKYLNFVFNWKWCVSIACTLCIFLMLGGAKDLKILGDFRYYFGKDNPQRLAFEKLENIYNKDDSILIAIRPKKGGIFNRKTLSCVKELTKESWHVPFSTRVDSLSNFQHTMAESDNLIVRDLVEDPSALNPDQLEAINKTAFSEPLLKGNIVSNDARMTAVNIRIELPGKENNELFQVTNYVRTMIAQLEHKYPDHEFYLSGVVMLGHAFNEAAQNDMKTLIPIMYSIILIVMILMLRSISSVLLTFAIIFLSMSGAIGMAGWLNIPLSPPSAMAPTIIAMLAIADCVHIIKTISIRMAHGLSKREAIVSSVRTNFQPVFLTSLTTVVGFLSLNFSDTPPYHDLGNIVAIGVTLAYILSITFLPALLLICPFKVKKSIERNPHNRFAAIGDLALKMKAPVLIISLLLTVILGGRISKIELNDQFVKYFEPSIRFRKDTDFIMKNFTGIYKVNYSIGANGPLGIAEPLYLRKLDQFTAWLRSQPEVTHVNSITDTFKRLNKNLHSDDPSYYKLPDNRELASQYLLLYEMSLPYGLDLNNQINVNKSATKIAISLKNLSTKDILWFEAKSREWLKNNCPEYMHALGISPAIMFSNISQRNVKAMFRGLLLAFISITVVLIIAFRSFEYGILSLIPNIIPIILTYGLWSVVVGKAGFEIAMVGSITLGIIVDDTIHFLSKYIKYRKDEKKGTEEAIRLTFENIGSALFTTSAVLVLGFMVYLFSSFKINLTLGILSTITIVLALLTDFLLLPSMIAFIDQIKTLCFQKPVAGATELPPAS